MGVLILFGAGFIIGGIVGIVIMCLCASSRKGFDEERYFGEDDKGEW